MLCGNTDDHARNHAAFWDGRALTLTPAYDVCPQPRAGGEAAQIMAIGRDGFRMSRVAGAIRARFAEPRRTLRELFARIVFNVLCGNTDDHARNHARSPTARSR